MMDHWSLSKEAFGLLSGILLVAPWFRQYGSLLRIGRLKKVKTDMPLHARILKRRQDSLNQPKVLDLALTVTGLLFLIVSFGLGVVISLTTPAR